MAKKNIETLSKCCLSKALYNGNELVCQGCGKPCDFFVKDSYSYNQVLFENQLTQLKNKINYKKIIYFFIIFYLFYLLLLFVFYQLNFIYFT